jgi:hypothetical protein
MISILKIFEGKLIKLPLLKIWPTAPAGLKSISKPTKPKKPKTIKDDDDNNTHEE